MIVTLDEFNEADRQTIARAASAEEIKGVSGIAKRFT
jgi:hypothetical protein